MERIKLKCPTCWAETYIVVTPEDEDEKIDVTWQTHNVGHARPTVQRRDPVSEEEEANLLRWRAEEQALIEGDTAAEQYDNAAARYEADE